MSKRLVHTPEGVRDIYGLEYAKKLAVQNMLHDKFKEFGYKDIQTPSFEFFDVFGKEIGTTASKDLYKFFDKEGNTLALRPDFTPSMARSAAKYFMEETLPVRFTYSGNAFTNTSNLQGKLKETTQMGVELFNDNSLEADAEMINLAVESLLSTGLKEFQISIGEIQFFKGLCEEAGLDEETEYELREFISSKNTFGAEELLVSKGLPKDKIDVLLSISDAFGSLDVLVEMKNIVKNSRSLQAIEHLEKLYDVLCLYGVEKYVSFDLGMLSKYNYYTGVIFKGYTYGVGDAVLTGGRYNQLLSYFGKDAAAIGFMIIVDDLMIALSSQKIAPECEPEGTLIVYEKSNLKDAIVKAKELRKNGTIAELMEKATDKSKEDYEAFATNNQIKEVVFL
ncbi:MAG: ATP phosphoribosyltransferase regulatory subunit [Lachnospiraceae bacterium]|nr:ATP phosphoribosyltransferase regulatory subunit [Lachnospiraceae bacterium]